MPRTVQIIEPSDVEIGTNHIHTVIGAALVVTLLTQEPRAGEESSEDTVRRLVAQFLTILSGAGVTVVRAEEVPAAFREETT